MKDLHKEKASLIFNVTYEEVSKEQRMFAKQQMYFESCGCDNLDSQFQRIIDIDVSLLEQQVLTRLLTKRQPIGETYE